MERATFGKRPSRARAGVTLDPYDDELPRSSLQRLFNFLESLSEAVLSDALDEATVKQAFGPALVSFWPHAATLLAPPNQADDFLNPTPRIAQLYLRWR